METALKQRLVGAAVLVALAVIFLPMLIQGPAPESGAADVSLDVPPQPGGDFETREIPLPGKDPLESIDFAFEIPYDQPGTDLTAEKPAYWQIVASVPLTGPDLETVFLAPVYQHKPRK